MASYTPPTENLAIFDPRVFTNDITPITTGEGDKRYLRFPTAQGTENLSAINVGGVATFLDNTIFTDNWTLNDTQTVPTSTISATCLPATNPVLELKRNTGGAVFEETNITQNGVSYTTSAGSTTTATWTDIIAGSGSVGTLNSVLANGNTATGTYAVINLVDTDVGGALNPILNLQNTNATGSVAMEVYKNKPTAGVAGDVLFTQSVFGKDAGNLKQEYTRISHTLRDASTGGEDGSIEFSCFVNNVINTFIQINGNQNEINFLKSLDMEGHNIRTSTGNMTLTTASSGGNGNITIDANGTNAVGDITISAKNNMVLSCGTAPDTIDLQGEVKMTNGRQIKFSNASNADTGLAFSQAFTMTDNIEFGSLQKDRLQLFHATSGTATTLLKGEVQFNSNNGVVIGGATYRLNGFGSTESDISTGLIRELNITNDSATGGIFNYTNTSGSNGITISSNNYIALDSTSFLYIINNCPTSAVGLPSGAIWSNSGVLSIV
jgi:hypothetical protein